jgi:hypothetical protein
MTKIEKIIQSAEDECEGANFHDRCGMASDLFNSIKNIVDEKNHLILARAIYDSVTARM